MSNFFCHPVFLVRLGRDSKFVVVQVTGSHKGRNAKDCGSIGGGEKATVLLTGTGFKDMAVFQGKVALPEAIDNSVEAVLALPF